jgi:hypothetical protein
MSVTSICTVSELNCCHTTMTCPIIGSGTGAAIIPRACVEQEMTFRLLKTRPITPERQVRLQPISSPPTFVAAERDKLERTCSIADWKLMLSCSAGRTQGQEGRNTRGSAAVSA